MHVDLENRVVVVTGSTRGLGREMVDAFARCGADVVVSGRRQEVCDGVAAEVTSTSGRRVVGIACHMGRWDQVDQLAQRAIEEFGRVDVLVNNAGMAPLYDSLPAVSEELFDKTIGVNLKGPFRLTALLGTQMAGGRGGSIINISSTGAERPQPAFVPYAAAKAGLNAMTIGLAHAFGPTVRVNGIMPGPFATDISDGWDWERINRRLEGFALKRVGQPHEIVGAVLYFASDDSSYTTGTILRIDGGER